MAGKTQFPRIKKVRTFVVQGVGSGGDYHNVREANDDAEKATGSDDVR